MKLPKFISRNHRENGGESSSSKSRQLLITDLPFQPHKNVAAIMNFDKSLYMTPKGLSLTPKAPQPGATSAHNAAGRYVKSVQPKRLQRNPKCYSGGGVQATPISFKPTPTVRKITNDMFTTPTRPTAILKAIDNKPNVVVDRSSKCCDVVDSAPSRRSTAALPSAAIEQQSEYSSSKQENMQTPSKLDTALLETPAPPTQTTSRFSLSKLTKFVSKSALKVMSRKQSSSPMSLENSTASSSSSSSVSVSIVSPPTPSFASFADDDDDDHDDDKEKENKTKTKNAHVETTPAAVTKMTTPSQQKSVAKIAQPPNMPPPPLPVVQPPKQQQQLMPPPAQNTGESQTNPSVYRSEQQRSELEKKVARLVEEYEKRLCSQTRAAPNNTYTRRVPNMGIASVMLREIKKKQYESSSSSSSSTVVGSVSKTCLPHTLFPSKTSTTVATEASASESAKNDASQQADHYNNNNDDQDSTLSPQTSSTYDRLSHTPATFQPSSAHSQQPPPFLGDDAATPLNNNTTTTNNNNTRKSIRPIVKSLSSPLVPMAPPPSSNKQQSPTTSTATTNCRISVYSSKKLNFAAATVTAQLKQQQQPYESFSETVF